MFVRFKELREESGLTQKDLSRKIKTHIDIINSIENGFNAPIEVLKKYAIYFEVTADYILELTDDKQGYSDRPTK